VPDSFTNLVTAALMRNAAFRRQGCRMNQAFRKVEKDSGSKSAQNVVQPFVAYATKGGHLFVNK
jgi:hypothetical protein